MRPRQEIKKTNLLLLAILSALVLLSPGFLAVLNVPAAYAATTILNVSNNDGSSILPKIAVSEDGENIYLVWQDATPGNNEIFFASSADEGLTFGEPTNISNSDGLSSFPQIAVSGENIHIVWQDTSPADDIFVASSSDGGSSFGEPVNVSNTTNGVSASPQVAVAEDNVFVTWHDSSTGDLEVLFAASDNGAASFGEVINLSNTTDGVSASPQIALSGNGTIHVVWQDTFPASDIFMSSSVNGGANFTEPINISSTEEDGSFSPRVAVNGEAIYVTWQDSSPGNNDIFFASSTDEGSAFNVTNISQNAGLSVSPALIADPGTENVFVTWADNTDTGGAFDIFFASTTDGGSNFSDPSNVSVNSGQSSLPQVHLISGTETVYLSWMDNSLDISNSEIMLGASPDGGETFGCTINVSNNPTSSSIPQLILAPNSETVHVVWQDPIEPGNFEVLLHSGLVPAETSMTIDEVSNTSPKWDLDVVEVAGTVGSGAETTDTVTVDWGDGSATEDIPVDGCDWGPVSHTYPPSALASNPNQLSATLFSANGTQKAAASPAEINVQKHSTTVTLNPVSSVIQGSEVSVVGSLEDADTAEGIGGHNITFSGTGAVGILEQATTETGGDAGAFSTTGTAPNATGSLQSVQAHFAGSDLYEAADSVIRAYDIVSMSAVQFNVTAADPFIDLAGFFAFNATIEFDELLSDGAVFVSECESPASGRYSSLDLCLSISSAVEMAEGTLARVTISYDGKLPEGASPEQVDVFHEELTTDGVAIVDITESRDLDAETVTGRTSTFSSFIAGLALHDPEPAGAHRTQVFLGDGNIANLRDIANFQNSSATATASFDKASYRLSEHPVLTLIDDNGDVDPDKLDIVFAGIKSESSDPDILTITLTENETGSGVFSGSFAFTSDVTSSETGVLHAKAGEELSVRYISGARAEVVIDGITEAGIVQISDSIVDEGVCLKPIGGAINLELIDAQLGPDGLITVSIGYNNSILRGFDPSSFRMVHKLDASWIDVTLSGGVNTDAMTVTGQTNTTGPFSIAVEVDDCSGGAGGGLGRPGTGIVVDFVASLAARSGGGGGGRSSPAAPQVSVQTSISDPVPSGNNVATEVPIIEGGSGGGPNTGGGKGTIKVLFDSVTSPGKVEVTPLAISPDSPGISTVSGDSSQGTIADDPATSFVTAGQIYNISLSSQMAFEGLIDITIPYNESQAITESSIRFLHFNGTSWEDETIALDLQNDTVTGRVSSLSPVVAAIVNDGTFDEEYFEQHPLDRMRSTNSVPVRFFDESTGMELTGAASPKQKIMVVDTTMNLQRAEQDFVYLISVFDSDGVALEITVLEGSLGRGEQADLEAGWTAPGRGIYDFRILVLDSIESTDATMLKQHSSGTIEVK